MSFLLDLSFQYVSRDKSSHPVTLSFNFSFAIQVKNNTQDFLMNSSRSFPQFALKR